MTETGSGTTGGGGEIPVMPAAGSAGSTGSPQAGQGASGSTGSPQAGPKTGWQWQPWVETPAVAASQEEKTLGLVTNLLAIPCGWLGPLILWLVKKDTSRFIDVTAKETLNFELSVMIYFVAGSFVAVPLIFLCGIGALFWVALGVGNLVFLILAAVKTNEVMIYRFPVNLRLIK